MLLQRVVTAVIVAPIALACVFLLPLFEFSLFVAAILMIGAWEWANFANVKPWFRIVYALIIGLIIFAAYFLPAMLVLSVSMIWWLAALVFVTRYPSLDSVWNHRVTILLIGIIALVPGWVALTELKQYADGSYLICLLFFLIWGADIGAYFSGKAFGTTKLAPRVSPGKSWAGFYGGLVSVSLIAGAMAYWFGEPLWYTPAFAIFLAACAGIAMVSMLGDLTISMFKRNRDIKDSSNLLPGHGGFLDRIDSLLSAGPTFALYVLWASWV